VPTTLCQPDSSILHDLAPSSRAFRFVYAHSFPPQVDDEDHFASTTANTHGVEALLYPERPILARSWIYQPSGYFRNGVLPKFDDPDADAVTLSTTTATFTAPAEPKSTMTTWLDKTTGPETKNILPSKETGFTKALRPTRVTFRPGDKLGTRRARPASKVGGKKPLWKSTTATGFKPVEEQSGPLPKIIASRPPGNSKKFPSRPEGKPGPETTGSVRNVSNQAATPVCPATACPTFVPFALACPFLCCTAD
jgi:hypothetical protein